MKITKKSHFLAIFGVVFVLAGILKAEGTQKPIRIEWEDLKSANLLFSGEIVDGTGRLSGKKALKVENLTEESVKMPILRLDNPRISLPHYVLRGFASYSEVQGEGYFEMWSIFEGGKRFFSRTIEEKGPLGVICGSADGRFFALPFSNSSGAVPLALEVNVVLPPRSSLLIGPMTMAQADTLPTLLEPVDAWWSGQVAGLAGGLLGGLLGCLGALLGWLSGRGKARTFCRMASRWMIPVGVALFAAGIFAVVRKQPYAVYYPLLLLGVLYTVLGFTTAQVIRRRFKNIEARTLEAKDIL